MSSADKQLTGRTAFVTGGNQGIGLEIAGVLADAGATVVAASRRAHTMSSPGGRVIHGVPLDVTDEQACRKAIRKCQDAHGSLDILINNAGIAESSKFLQMSTEAWRRHMTIDVDAPMWLTQAALPAMLERGQGRVVSIGSVASHIGVPYVAAYVAAKHAILGLTRSLAIEYARSGVTFNCVSPYYVETPMAVATIDNIMAKTGRTREEASAALQTPQGRIVQADEVAAMCLYLCSDSARSINGQSLGIDGGRVYA